MPKYHYPESMRRIAADNTINDLMYFLAWLRDNQIDISAADDESIAAHFIGIDMEKVREERRAFLVRHRAQVAKLK